jgi:hypothetical protein
VKRGGGPTGRLVVWEWPSAATRLLGSTSAGGDLSDATFSGDGQAVRVVDLRGSMLEYREGAAVESGAQHSWALADGPVPPSWQAAFSPEGKYLAVMNAERIKLYTVDPFELLTDAFHFPAPGYRIAGLSFDPGSDFVIALAEDPKPAAKTAPYAAFWWTTGQKPMPMNDCKDLALQSQFPNAPFVGFDYRSQRTELAWGAPEGRVVTSRKEGTNYGEKVLSLRAKKLPSSPMLLAYDGAGGRLAVGVWVREAVVGAPERTVTQVELFDPQIGESVPGSVLALDGAARDLAVGDGGSCVAALLEGGRLALVTVGPARATAGPEFLKLIGDAIACQPKGALLAVLTREGKVLLWDPAADRAVRTLTAGAPLTGPLAFAVDGQRLAAGAAGRAVVFDVNDGHIVRDLTVDRVGPCRQLYFGPDGRTLVAGWDGESPEQTEGVGVVSIWPLEEGRAPLRVDLGDRYPVTKAALHPAANRLATALQGNSVTLWALGLREEGVQEVASLKGRTYAWGLRFSPDGRTLAAAYGDGKVKLWRAAPAPAR